jgi:addiction module RelE/StbE family toxin
MKLFWSKRFVRDLKRLILQNPQLKISIEKALYELENDYNDSSLRTHKLKGDLEGCWSCSIDSSNRIIFEFVHYPDDDRIAINLLTLGSHDQVY